MIESCGNTIAPVENAGRWGACQLRPGHYGDCVEVSGRDSTRMLAYERSKQIMRYRYDSAHDDSIGIEVLVEVATTYLGAAAFTNHSNQLDDSTKDNLVKAGAVILAAIDHITREEERNAARR